MEARRIARGGFPVYFGFDAHQPSHGQQNATLGQFGSYLWDLAKRCDFPCPVGIAGHRNSPANGPVTATADNALLPFGSHEDYILGIFLGSGWSVDREAG